jgi:hypothetical protein
MTPTNLFEKLIGKWQGTVRTWFEPDVVADESHVTGELAFAINMRFVRHTYTGSMQGKPRHGEELIAYNATTRFFQISWMDSFHMSQSILFSEGAATEQGFSVRGNYDVGENLPQWGWRTEFALLGEDLLTITAYNIMPNEPESIAVETKYHRVR